MRHAYLYSRFSTEKQEDGDSLRRQTALARSYCERQGLILEAATLADLGVSGFNGDNSAAGELSGFLQAVDDGKIPTGSVLIVENIDRLSRLPPNKANQLLQRIIDAGVSLVTTSPEREYTAENIGGFGPWIELQVSMLLAHEESSKKSKRLKQMWEQKRRDMTDGKADGTITPVKPPAWLKLAADKRAWIIKEDMAAAVRRMFTLAGGGMGQGVIARILHKEYPDGFRGNGWHTWGIGATLRNREVIGEYQPHTGGAAKAGRKSTRKPHGDAIIGFFPPIVSEAEFYAVQASIDGRKRRGAGGRVKGVPNLFSSILFDARDGRTMVINASGGKRHVVSSGAIRRQPGSVYAYFPYAALETALLRKFKELKASDILARNGHENKVEVLSGKLASINHKIAVVRKRADAGDEITIFLDMIADYEREKKAVAAELEKEKAAATSVGAEALGEAQSLIDLMSKAKDAERDMLRLKIRARIRQLVNEAWLLTVSRGQCRIAVVQLWFAEGGSHRDYVIVYRAPGKRRVGGWDVTTLAPEFAVPAGKKGSLDLRRREDAAKLAECLEALPSWDAFSPTEGQGEEDGADDS